VAEDTARAYGLRVDHGQQIVDALDPVYGSRNLDRAVMREVARHHATQGCAAATRLDRQSLDADAAALQRSGDTNGERRLLRLPGKTHAEAPDVTVVASKKSNGRAFPPARKSLGQHFLSDPRILSRIADALAPRDDETVIEIGPGRGALTRELLARAGRVVAIEIDRALAAKLRERYAGDPRLDVIERDVLETDLGVLAGGAFALVGNVPYYITTPILFHALRPPRPTRAVYLVQKEVADRLSASPGTKAYGALTVNVGAVASVETLFRVPPGAFSPPPSVDSAVVRVTPRTNPAVEPGEEERFRVLVQQTFGMRRKQMRRVVRSVLSVPASRAEELLAVAGIETEARPETLSAEQFAALLRAAGT
jgi:16S rRNA (adenine1518-N6/adenine1519-N6)-dimethyltransferase